MRYLIVVILLVAGCTSTKFANANDESAKQKIVGIWAMIPLKNGIANVAVFNEDGTNVLYSYTCDFNKKTITYDEQSTEKATYSIKDDLLTIYPSNSKNESFNLKVNQLSNKTMELTQFIDKWSLDFS